jgi:hypothetical protein
MKGAVVVEVASKNLEGARDGLARAIACGALGPGRTVERDGDGCAFDGGRIDVKADGRVTWELSLRGLEQLRVAEAVVLAATVSVAATLGWSLIVYAALGTGLVVRRQRQRLTARLHHPQAGAEPQRAGPDHEAARFEKSAPIHFSNIFYCDLCASG